jgi:predicted GNAT superfamily acetyltransferase
VQGDITLRSLSSPADYLAAVELQKLTWGRDSSEIAPLSILKIAQKVGGVSAGAFAPDGRLLGFVFGLTGVRDGKPVHWSHMLAVAPESRDLGLGTRLKLYQRELLLPLGVELVEWTFDPLEARNAHVNFNHLGAGVSAYVRDMYEGETGSDLAKGIGTDRLIVAWRIASQRVVDVIAGRRPETTQYRDAPIANPCGAEIELPPLGPPVDGGMKNLPVVRIETPANIQAIKDSDPNAGAAWRASTRRAFEHYLPSGFVVDAFFRDPDGRCYYGLIRT